MTSIGPVPMEVDLDDFAESFQDHGMYPHQVAEFVTELVSNAGRAIGGNPPKGDHAS